MNIVRWCRRFFFGCIERNLYQRIKRNKNVRIENKHFHRMIKKKNHCFKSKIIDYLINDIKSIIREIYRNLSKKVLLFLFNYFLNSKYFIKKLNVIFSLLFLRVIVKTEASVKEL